MGNVVHMALVGQSHIAGDIKTAVGINQHVLQSQAQMLSGKVWVVVALEPAAKTAPSVLRMVAQNVGAFVALSALEVATQVYVPAIVSAHVVNRGVVAVNARNGYQFHFLEVVIAKEKTGRIGQCLGAQVKALVAVEAAGIDEADIQAMKGRWGPLLFFECVAQEALVLLVGAVARRKHIHGVHHLFHAAYRYAVIDVSAEAFPGAAVPFGQVMGVGGACLVKASPNPKVFFLVEVEAVDA